LCRLFSSNQKKKTREEREKELVEKASQRNEEGQNGRGRVRRKDEEVAVRRDKSEEGMEAEVESRKCARCPLHQVN
jgi:hypothetical protein